MFSFEFLNEMINHTVIEIFATEMCVTSSRFYFEDTVFNCEDGNIECTSAKIKDENIFLTIRFFIKTVSDGSCGGFVNNTHDIHTGNGTCVFGGLTLGIIEISWDCNDGIIDFFTEVSFSNFFHFAHDHRGDFFRKKFFAFTLVINFDLWFSISFNYIEWPMFLIRLDTRVSIFSTDQTFSIEHGVGWVHCSLIFSSITDQMF